MTKYYISGPYDYKGSGWGFAHYSYGFLMDLFEKMLIADGKEIAGKFNYPFKDKIKLDANKDNVHISFLPPDVALIIPGAFNICVFAWEFDKLPNIPDVSKSFFFKEYASALKEFDAVITLSSFAQQTLKSYGIRSYVLPSPIIEPINISNDISNIRCHALSMRKDFYRSANRPRASIPLSSVIDKVPYEKRFLYIFNPHDIRKNFGNLVTAFQRFNEEHPDSILILKMTYTGTIDKLQKVAFAREFPAFPGTTFSNVYIITSRLSDDEMSALMGACQNYISPTRAEGQNLPLGEAMLAGSICIAPNHTSMADYIDSEVAVVLDSYPWQISEETHSYSEFWGLSWNGISEEAILDGMNRAINLTEEQKVAIIDKARKRIKEFASEETILKKWNKIKHSLKIKD